MGKVKALGKKLLGSNTEGSTKIFLQNICRKKKKEQLKPKCINAPFNGKEKNLSTDDAKALGPFSVSIFIH